VKEVYQWEKRKVIR